MPRQTVMPFCGMAFLIAASGRHTNAQSNYGIDFVTVGHAGNRSANAAEMGSLANFYLPGRVENEFRIMRTNLTVGEWVEFVRAYAPHYRGSYLPELTGFEISREVDNQGNVAWNVLPGAENYAIDATWEMAARYCNWLQNNKGSSRPDFESGVYDTSTFGRNTDGTLTHQRNPAPGANYWIPSWDEFAKAAYYDPNRYGNGEEGYWASPNMSDVPLIVGFPEDGGQTIGELVFDLGRTFSEWDVLQYPDVQSYFGLLDVSGTVPTWTSGHFFPGYGFLTYGSYAGSPIGAVIDRLDMPAEHSPDGNAGSIRICMTIPSPAGTCVPVFWTIATLLLRRRKWN